MRSILEMSSSDLFFYYDTVPIEQGNESELLNSVLQPKKSMFYNRKFGSGIRESTNYPSGIAMLIGVPYDIMNTIATRNTQVVDGTRKQKDRRFASSQEAISIEQNNKGEVNVMISYINYDDFEEKNKNINIPIGSLS